MKKNFINANMTRKMFVPERVALLLALVVCADSHAGDVKILQAEFQQAADQSWVVNVTLEHDDSGWDHYADLWQITDQEGNVLAMRELLHPHEDEQPFTRGLDSVYIPTEVSTLYIEAHDLVHGWTPNRLEIDLSKAKNGRLTVLAH